MTVPQWLTDALTSTTGPFATVSAPFELPDVITSSAVHGPPSRDDVLYKYACSLRGKGVTVTRAVLAMQEAWKRCEQPPGHPYPLKKALEKIDRAWGYDYTSPNGAGQTEAATPRSWEPVDLTPYLNGQISRPQPTIGLARSDGLRLLYPGKEHTVIGEMESGKSWFACASCAAELSSGNRVLYIHFEEADPTDTLERFQALGISNDTILTRFTFVGPDQPVTGDNLAKLLADPRPTLVVLDGVNEAMSLHRLGVREEDGAAAFRRLLVKPCTALGAATLAADHVVKDREKRGRDPLGSVHKGNGLTGALILLENADPFGRDLRGRSHLFVTKDRPGHLRRNGRPSSIPGKTFLGELVVDDTRSYRNQLDLVFWAPADRPDRDGSEAVDQASRDEDLVLAAAVKLAARGKPLNTRTMRAAVKGIGNGRIDTALTRLVLDSELEETAGTRGARVFTVPGDQHD